MLGKKIHGGLLEAYEGWYEEDSEPRAEYEKEMEGHEVWQDYDQWLRDWCERRILKDQPERHLEIYCEWNGLIGWHHTLFDLATGGGVRQGRVLR